MVAITGHHHDLGVMTKGLDRWLARRWPTAQDIRVHDVEYFEYSGLSNETAGLWVTWRENGDDKKQKMILRLPPAGGRGVFQEYDLVKQARIQTVLAGAGYPTVPPVGVEVNEEFLGSKFMLMPFVAGNIPANNDFFSGGWIVGLSPDQRRELCTNFVQTLAAIHRADWDKLGLRDVARRGVPGLEAEWHWWQDYRAWADMDGEPKESALVERLAQWCLERWPASEPPSSVVWGDARIGNVIFADDLSVRAALDWETVTIAPAEVDLGWYFACRRLLQEALGVTNGAELEGFPTEDGDLQVWEAAVGRSVADFEWYLMFGALRTATCVLAIRRAARLSGNDEWLQTGVLPEWVMAQI